MKHNQPVHVIGGGLAGAEAAFALAGQGVEVVLHEMRPLHMTKAHVTGRLAELVCSNSLRSDDAQYNAVGLLHEEMRRLNSLVIRAADQNRVPAGSALAVDREGFSKTIEAALASEPLAAIERGEVEAIPENWESAIIATGPLTSPSLTSDVRRLTGQDTLAFFDAIAPIVLKDSIDFTKAWRQSRYDKGACYDKGASHDKGDGADYINCPLNQEQYEVFIDALMGAKTMDFRAWEKDTPYFEGCLPVEVMASRGRQTLAFGPMKPVGLSNPHDLKTRPHAVLQLRQDNALGSLYNIVGFQTKMTHGEQKRVFRMIPGLENAEFARLGGMHRNTFINSPRLLDKTLRLKSDPRIRFAGQITGCEGYVESAAIGLLAGRFAAASRLGLEAKPPPLETALGALLNHLTGGADSRTFQPMNVNFGLFPPLNANDYQGQRQPRGRQAKLALSERALKALDEWRREEEK